MGWCDGFSKYEALKMVKWGQVINQRTVIAWNNEQNLLIGISNSVSVGFQVLLMIKF